MRSSGNRNGACMRWSAGEAEGAAAAAERFSAGTASGASPKKNSGGIRHEAIEKAQNGEGKGKKKTIKGKEKAGNKTLSGPDIETLGYEREGVPALVRPRRRLGGLS